MSKLIDELDRENSVEINGRWYLTKPINYFTYGSLFNRLKDCIKILKGKAIAVHYKEDELYSIN